MANNPPFPVSPILYTCEDTRLGWLLVASSERGVCFVWLGGSPREARRSLERVFPFAALADLAERTDAARPGAALVGWARAIRESLEGERHKLDVPLNVRGSTFEKRVWAALRGIPRGQTRSYSEIAREIGSPRGARAVANACAANPAPLVTPCHRVVRSDGSIGGYALGVRRKCLLLEHEGALD